MRILIALALALLPVSAQAKTLCTALADAATGKMLMQEGDCETRVTPASTFKIALALMGYDSGFLKDEHTPLLPFKEGYPDWIKAWRTDTDPAAWMKKSVVWYSQRITENLGEERFRAYTQSLGYGNEDVSGDPGKNNGLERSWIGSSLKISPAEQVGFLRRLVRRELPVSPAAFDMTAAITAQPPLPGGWELYGKTGSAFLRKPDGSQDRTRAYGWFVGWAARGERSIVFARLIQTEKREAIGSGLVARDTFLKELPGLLPKS
ncbi:class D beta-lactamase [Mesorhizobium sp. LHD-90]|uniref:class D beta-lactamase n=1 Tax=Mesorhizobium sp. LHD-90 TaxID=3071414 RepID=UPI0027E10564|nr:class D beta-lactamase [Mesorhizobium sp. LHD-90]MDQ6436873.1 class D beta-lactamase [Mesorhizobium sp. LHD-90]